MEKTSQNVSSNVLTRKVSTVTGFAVIGISVAVFFTVYFAAVQG